MFSKKWTDILKWGFLLKVRLKRRIVLEMIYMLDAIG